jgi:hypothetical protein
MQQWRKLRAQGIEIPQPRQQILDDLRDFMTPHVTNGHEVIVMMDANSPSNDDAITQFTDATGLYDLMADFLPDNPPPHTNVATTKSTISLAP